MTVLSTQLNPRSAEFAANAQTMQAVVDDLRAHLERIAQGGGEAARAKHTARGKLLPRERVQMLLDPGTPFLEVAPLAALNMYNNDAPSAGVIVGIGDFRQEKGRGSYGCFAVSGPDGGEWADYIAEIKREGRDVQQDALDNPEYADDETLELMEMLMDERQKRAA